MGIPDSKEDEHSLLRARGMPLKDIPTEVRKT